jgi:hypothetical protein
MRINTAWHHDAVARIHHARLARYWQTAWICNRDNLFARDTDFRWANSVRCYNTITLDYQIHGNTPDWRKAAPSVGSLNPKGGFRPMPISAGRRPGHIAGEAGAICFRHHHTFAHL